ncbi:MAG TPA: L,D-transpeptidase [Devosiaceae bacterium]|nr:L,D-transpeptidase [Devosiaceae bacterium]
MSLRVPVFLLLFFLATPALASNISVNIDISGQTMTVRIDGAAKYHWPVSTGRRGFGTPTGYYRPIRMARVHYSRKYHNSPMPHAIFFRGGYAIHGTEYVGSLGRKASHGCVRLRPANAATLFRLVKQNGAENTAISVHG